MATLTYIGEEGREGGREEGREGEERERTRARERASAREIREIRDREKFNI